MSGYCSTNGDRLFVLHCSVDVTRDSPIWQSPTADAEEIVTKALPDLARWLYCQLQAEYDHLSLDEAIKEGIMPVSTKQPAGSMSATRPG